MGLHPESEYPREFIDAVRNVPVGQNTGVVRSSVGFHILKVVDRQQADPGMTVSETHARHILLRTGPQLSAQQAQARLASVRQQIVSGKLDFAQAARDVSQDGTAGNGGDLGWAAPGQFVPEFSEVLDRLQPGQISQPFATRYGVHIVQLLERRSAPMTRQQELTLARNALKQQKEAEVIADWEQQLRAQAYIEMREPPR